MSRSAYTVAAALIFVAVTIPTYVGLVLDGGLPPPANASIANALEWLSKSTPASAGLAGTIAVTVVITIAAVAPLLYAIGSEEALTVVISTMLTLTTWGLVFSSSTVFDVMLASIIYMANLILTALIYSRKLQQEY